MKQKQKAKLWESDNQRYGRNVRALRERAGLSQKAVAQAMTERGHQSWYQNTLTRIESGEQPLKLAEAEDLKDILGTSLERLTWATQEAQATEFMYALGAGVVRAHEAVAAAAFDLLAAISTVHRWADHYKDDPSDRVQEARGDAAGRTEEYDLDAAINEGVRRWEHRGEPPG